MRQYNAWIAPPECSEDTGRKDFFVEAAVVLDANVLLDLYEYTPQARNQVFAALETVSPRLWLPHQVGLEFVRNRHRVVHGHNKALQDAPSQINRKLMEAVKAVVDARTLVQDMLQTYNRDAQAQQKLSEEINQEAVLDRLGTWKDLLMNHVNELKNAQYLTLGTLRTGDSILEKVAALFGDNVGAPPDPEILRMRVETAVTYRFPNKIPPGFSDLKSTPLQSAGDYLLWEEIIDYAATLPHPRRVLLVSADGKEDWYQPAQFGVQSRPWPMLFDEIKQRAGASLRIEQPQEFFDGIRLYKDVDITEETSAEIKRAAESLERADESLVSDIEITESDAAVIEPPSDLSLLAYQAAGLTTSVVRHAIRAPEHRLFRWWLIGVTAELGRRRPAEAEPPVEMPAAIRCDGPPGPHWLRGTVLSEGEWPYRTSTWIAPWFVQVVRSAPEADRLVLQRLAARQADAR